MSVLTRLRDTAMQSARAFGLEVRRNGPRARADLRLVDHLRRHGVGLVLDVGANRGQFATELFDAGYRGRIVSFEALPGAHRELSAAAAARGPDWQVAPAMALSDRSGTVEFHVTEADTSSSMLTPTSGFVEALPQVAVRETLTVPTERLDVAAAPYITGDPRLFLKLDVQGAEGLVLAGSQQILALSSGVTIEVCTEALYAGQTGILELLALLQQQGFELWDINCAYRDAATHRMAAADLVAFRPAA